MFPSGSEAVLLRRPPGGFSCEVSCAVLGVGITGPGCGQNYFAEVLDLAAGLGLWDTRLAGPTARTDRAWRLMYTRRSGIRSIGTYALFVLHVVSALATIPESPSSFR